jgi:hypothetical protein
MRAVHAALSKISSPYDARIIALEGIISLLASRCPYQNALGGIFVNLSALSTSSKRRPHAVIAITRRRDGCHTVTVAFGGHRAG